MQRRKGNRRKCLCHFVRSSCIYVNKSDRLFKKSEKMTLKMVWYGIRVLLPPARTAGIKLHHSTLKLKIANLWLTK